MHTGTQRTHELNNSRNVSKLYLCINNCEIEQARRSMDARVK